jgi:probable F420-dependent oxidoreductase
VLKIDTEISCSDISKVSRLAMKAERIGYDGIFVNETKHDPFIQAALVSTNTRKVEIGTSIAVAFARSPTLTAYSAWDIQKLSHGRFILGLGSQVKGHIERRFGMKWESPIPKMREYIEVVKSVWNSWQNGTKLDYSGRFYKVNLMTEFFSPGKIENPSIPIYLACVNRGMASLAGKLCDGVHIHPLHTERYLKEEIIPSIKMGMFKAGRKNISIAVSTFAAVGKEKKQIDRAVEQVRSHVAFYASTRSYSLVLEKHGFLELSKELHRLSLQGKWDDMRRLVSDDLLELFLVKGNYKEVAREIKDKYEGYVDRVRLYFPFDGDDNWKEFVAEFRS